MVCWSFVCMCLCVRYSRCSFGRSLLLQVFRHGPDSCSSSFQSSSFASSSCFTFSCCASFRSLPPLFHLPHLSSLCPNQWSNFLPSLPPSSFLLQTLCTHICHPISICLSLLSSLHAFLFIVSFTSLSIFFTFFFLYLVSQQLLLASFFLFLFLSISF